MRVNIPQLGDDVWVSVEANPMNDAYFKRACESTLHDGQVSKVSKDRMYDAEHSPIRTQLFFVTMHHIPSFVSTHFARHHVGIDFIGVESNRVDRGGSDKTGRFTPVNMSFLINAQALINISHKRLCNQASKETILVMQAIKESMTYADPLLAKYLVPTCIYRGGVCHELKSCKEHLKEKGL